MKRYAIETRLKSESRWHEFASSDDLDNALQYLDARRKDPRFRSMKMRLVEIVETRTVIEGEKE